MIDANIFNSNVRPPESPLNLLAQLAQYKGIQQTQQLQNQKIQEGQIQMQADAADRAAQAKATSIGSDGQAKFDQGVYLSELAKGAGSGRVIGAQTTFAKQAQENAKAQQEATAAKLSNAKQQVQLVGNAANSVLNAAPEMRPQAYTQILAALHQSGIDTSQMPQQYDEGLVTRYRDMAIDSSKQIDQKLADLQYNDKRPGVIADASKAAKVNAGTNAQGITAEQQQQNATTQRGQNMTSATAQRGQDLQYGAFSSQVPVGATGVQALMSMPPNEAATVKFYGDGNGDLANYMSRLNMNQKTNLIAKITAYNPAFKQSTYGVGLAVDKKFTSGNVSDQLMAIGTAREHMKTFDSLAAALDNGDIQAANKVGNALGIQFGSDKATNFKIAAQAFGGEVGKALDGAGVTAGEREQAAQSFNDAMSKGQFRGAIKTVDELLAGKQRAAKTAYDNAKKGSPNFGGGAGITVTDPRGGVHSFPDQAAADAFKKAAGIQ